MKLLPKQLMKGKLVSQLHNLDENQMIVFVNKESKFYLVEKKSGELTKIANPSGNIVIHSIVRVEDMLLIRDASSVIFFNCVTLKVDHFVLLDYQLEGKN